MKRLRLLSVLALVMLAPLVPSLQARPPSVQDPAPNFNVCLSNSESYVLADDTTGQYIYFCGGAQVASGQGELTVRGSWGRIVHVKGSRTVWIQWDRSAQGGYGAGFAYIRLNGIVTCEINDHDMSDVCP